jgi:hypothetical protein
MRRAVAVTCLAAVLLCLTAAPLFAQDQRPAEVGSRVKVTLLSPKSTVRGTLVGRVGDSIEVQAASPGDAAPTRIPLQNVRRLEVSVGQLHPVGRRMLLGAGIGGLTGALLGAVAPVCKPAGGWFDCFLAPTTRSESVAFYTVFIGASGLLTGVVAGAIGHEGWVPASVSGWQPVVAVRSGRVSVGLSLPLRR